MDFLKFLASFIIICGVVSGIVLFLGVEWENYQCTNYQEITGKETIYKALDSCYVKDNGVFERYDAYKARITAGNLKEDN